MVKNPDILVLDGALVPFGEQRARQILKVVLDLFGDRTVIAVLPNDREAEAFDVVVRLRDGRAELEERERPAPEADEAPEWADTGVERRVAGAVT
jgi:putative ABC transport system ATP-binding protein